MLCNDARAQRARATTEPRWQPIGDPTEVALLTLAIKGGIVPAALRAACRGGPRSRSTPTAKMMATQHDDARRDRAS